MNEQEKKILRYAQLAIKEMRAEGDFTPEDKAEMQKIQIDLGILRADILAQATILLLRA